MAALLGLACGVAITVAVVQLRRHRVAAQEADEAGQVHGQAAALLGILRSGGLIVGAHDEVLRSNPQARAWGLNRGDRIANRDVLELVRASRRDDQAISRELEIRRGVAAASLHLTVRVAPLEAGTMVVLADDRTPLLRADETRRDFVTNVSHELKTPIGAISLLAEAITQASDDPEAVAHFGDRIGTEAARLTQLVTQIINLSRLQADEPMLDAEVVSLRELSTRAVERCQELARDRQVSVVTATTPDVTVQGDFVLLADALTNLVQNAIAYSDEGSRVAVSHRLADDAGELFAELSVADNGIGIRPEDQQRIFERFYRVDYGRSRAHGGTGLGLAIVKHIAAVHGGTVTVWSQPGQGSTFTVRLPAVVLDTDSDSDDTLDTDLDEPPTHDRPTQKRQTQQPRKATA